MTVKFEKEQMISTTDLARNSRGIYSKLHKKRSLVLLRKNKPEAVLVDYSQYEKLVELAKKVELLENLIEDHEIEKEVKNRLNKNDYIEVNINAL